MKSKKICRILAITLSAAMLTACSGKDGGGEDAGSTTNAANEMTTRVIYMTDNEASEEASTTETLEVPEGMYLSELTGEPIDEAIKNQRPIAVMVDNDINALPHYEIAEADVVYEIMNSTANDRVSRLMVIRKDWGSIKQMGNVRSTRPTNLLLYPEWNAVLCHDGGPAVHIDAYLANDYTPRFNAMFPYDSSINKESWYTEFITEGDLERNFKSTGISPEYDKNRPADESHFEFAPYGTVVDLATDYSGAFDCTEVDMSKVFYHNGSKLIYNDDTQTYDFYECGSFHKDFEDGEVLTFKNVILQYVSFSELDANGYLIYNVLSADYNKGYYITNGKAVEIFWTKPEVLDHTRYYIYNEQGLLEEIVINAGKTYIGLIPHDTWDNMKLN